MVASLLGLLGRSTRVLRALFEAHIALARSEAKRDGARVMMGALLAAFALLCLCQVWVMAHVLAVIGLHALHLGWTLAVAVVTGADALVGLLTGLIARHQLSQPVLPETRELVKKTIDAAVG